MKKRALAVLLVVMAATLVMLAGCTGLPVIKTYAVTFSAGEGTGTVPTGETHVEGITFELPSASGLTKDGYHFTAWNDGTADYAAGAIYTMPAKDVTFTAQWEEDAPPVVMHTVTFDPNNEGETWTEQIEDGKTVAKPATDPVIASGKLFRYWGTEEGEYSFDTPVTADLTLTASYAYKLNFEAGEGTGAIEPIWVKMWTPMGITLPAETGLSHSEGKVFGGWTDGTNTYQAGDRFVGTANHTITAVWKDAATEITVSFETTYQGEGTAPESQTVIAGNTITLPENTFTAKNVGYVFKGWYESTNSSVLYQPGDTYTIPSDYAEETLVFKAKWDKGDFTVTYKAGAHASGADIVKNVKGGKIFLLDASEVTFTPDSNYMFAGWAKEGTTEVLSDGTYTIGENTVFVAQWIHMYAGLDNDYTAQIVLYFDTNEGLLYIPGEAEDGSQDQYIPLTLTLNGTAITVTLEGGTATNGTLENNLLSITLTYGGKTYTFGNGTPVVKHTVTFEPNNEGATWTEQVEDGKTVKKPATDPVIASGKLFRYWSTEDGMEYSFDTPVTADLTLYAVYAYKVTFSAGEGTGTVEPMWKTMWTPMGITLPDGTGLTHSEGKVFGGWTDGTDTYQAGDRYVGTANHTLTAVWKNVATEITVSFETAFQGEGTAPESQTGKKAGDTITLPENTFTAKSNYVGYVFKGWYVKGGSNTVLYQPGETYTILADYAEATLVFMAKWEKGKFTVTYKAGDHATGADIVKTDVTGGTYYLLEEITFTAESNYMFAGWKKEGGTESEVYAAGDKYTLGDNTVFVAQWQHVYVGYDNAYTSQIGLFFDTNSGLLAIFGEAEDGSQYQEVLLTFTQSGTAITITLEGGAAVSGTLDDNGLAITLTYGGKTYTFGNGAPTPAEPTITFAAAGGSGVAPTATAEYNASSGMYKIVLPANTYTAPEGKEFKCWSVNGNEYNAGTSYMANSGESVTITAVWKDVQPAFEGTTFVGNCTTPAKGGFLPSGGETYVKFIISTDKTKVQYTLSDGTVKEANLTDNSSSTWKPDIYGTDSLYYSVRMEAAYYLLVKADMSKLYLCNNNDEMLDNGEFTASVGEVGEYANVALKDLSGKNFVLSGGATEIYNGYTTINFSWDANFASYKVKLGGKTLARSYVTDENTEALSGTTFTATHSSSGQVMTFAFKKDGNTYQMIVLSIKNSDGTEALTAPVTLVEKTA